MAVDYVKLAATAKKLVTDNGRTIILVRKSEVPIDVNSPWLGNTTTETTLEVPALQMVPASVRIFGLAALGESGMLDQLIARTEIIYVCFQGEVKLDQYTIVRDGSVDYSIEATQELKPANTTLLGFIGVRR
tara:strand:+ start:9691 stop:10086 length:396 start_codon:yes stop_codon:yes gene_type:complete